MKNKIQPPLDTAEITFQKTGPFRSLRCQIQVLAAILWDVLRFWIFRQLFPVSKSKHAELVAGGIYDRDSDYHGMLGSATDDLFRIHKAHRHSGFTHYLVSHIFTELCHNRLLSPMTDSTSEWTEVSKDMWQSKRGGGAYFSTDAGKTYYCINDKKRKLYHSKTLDSIKKPQV